MSGVYALLSQNLDTDLKVKYAQIMLLKEHGSLNSPQNYILDISITNISQGMLSACFSL